MERNGIAVAGNILTDNVKMVEVYPQKGMLATITKESLAVGGCVPNTAIDLKKIDSNLNVFALGKIGNDEKGKYVLNEMQKIGLDVFGVKVCDSAPTSYSDVITVKSTGERTFFHNRGANAQFCPDDVELENLSCKILHLGYLMLLDSFDKIDEKGNTPAGKFLQRAQSLGIKTSVDMVSESSGNFNKVAQSALKFCDYVIINEIEVGQIANLTVRDLDGKLIEQNVEKAMQKVLKMGVREKVIVHCPEKAFCLGTNGDFTMVSSIKLPKDYIKGSVGAGDAFCAGALYGIYNGYCDKEILSFANAVAVSCLSKPDSVSGVRNKKEIEKLINEL